LRLRHDEFVRSLATRLSIYLRMDFTATVSQLETVTYRRFVERLPASTHLTLFKVESLPGTGILEIPALFSLALLERLLGGAGRLPDTPREITDAEVAVLDHLSQLLLREWCRHVGNLSETAAAVTGHETNARFLQTESVDTNLLVLELGMRMGDCAGTIQLAAGYDMLDPILRQLAPGHATNRPEHKPAASRELPWNSGLDHVQVLLTAAWQGLELPAGRLAQLKIGDILPVDGRQVHNVEIRLARLPKFIGRLGFSGNKRAVELLQPLHA
jgi:flagellar motor switch protein FliM